jgi:hypothetical protein
MSTPKRRPRSRALRPLPESLEGRQLLSAQVFGVDQDGDTWNLRLIGPGDLHVTYQDGTPATVNSSGQIDSIVVSGTDSQQSRLVGRVARGAVNGTPGDGRVFFQSFLETDGRSLPPLDPAQRANLFQPGNGIQAVDIPNFWLGHTGTTVRTPPATQPESPVEQGSIRIPDGVITLRFGGVDTTFTPPGGTPLDANDQNDRFNVTLGLPFTQGTSVIADRFVTSAQAATSQTGNTTQDAVFVNVIGRLNLFQANAIEGNTDAALAPAQFGTDIVAGAAPGGTIVTSEGSTAQGITGQIGDVRIGGNATNFTVLAIESALTTEQAGAPGPDENAKVSNFSVGGETQNVLLVAPGGSRNVFFGKGMDQVTINSLFISHLQANRGALNSNVTVNRSIDRVTIGGDVVNTNIQSGYAQGLAQIANNAIANSPVTRPIPIINQRTGAPGIDPDTGMMRTREVSVVTPPPTITNRIVDSRGTFSPLAQNGGNMTVRIAGDVVDSVFSASVEPNPALQPLPGTTPTTIDPGVFGDRDAAGRLNDAIFPTGMIHAKVEGTINNTNNTLVDPAVADQAFFASQVRVRPGPVVPPNVPEAPYPSGGGVAPDAPRVVGGLQSVRAQRRAQILSSAQRGTSAQAQSTAHPRPPRTQGSKRSKGG